MFNQDLNGVFFKGEMDRIRDPTPLAPTRSRNRTRKASKTLWTPEEDALLSTLVNNTDDWTAIALHFPNRTTKQVLSHWRKVADPKIVRGSWTCQEDQAILSWVTTNGAGKWALLADKMPGRIAKQCRERWCNHLDPQIKRTSWTPDEDRIIIETIKKIGTKWADIARHLPGRTDNSVKNRWNSTLRRKKLVIDIENHQDLNQTLNIQKDNTNIITSNDKIVNNNSVVENRRKLSELLEQKKQEFMSQQGNQ